MYYITNNNYFLFYYHGYNFILLCYIALIIVGVATYKRLPTAAPNQCCVGNEKQHAFCNCRKSFAWCKEKCDINPYCKGYSGSVGGGGKKSIEEGAYINNVTCHLATTGVHGNNQDCKDIDKSCTGYFFDNDGPIDPNASCGYSGYAGCYVKQSQIINYKT